MVSLSNKIQWTEIVGYMTSIQGKVRLLQLMAKLILKVV